MLLPDLPYERGINSMALAIRRVLQWVASSDPSSTDLRTSSWLTFGSTQGLSPTPWPHGLDAI